MTYNPNPPNAAAGLGTAAPGRSRFVTTNYGPQFLPDNLSDEDTAKAIEALNAYYKKLEDFWVTATGIQKSQIEAQMADAKQEIENRMTLGRLQSETSRYGYDLTRQSEIDRLKQSAKQFEATHALEMQKYGLSVAEAYTKYSQTSDMMWAQADFKNALGRVGQGLAPSPITTASAQPKAKNWQDFAALSGYNTPAVQAGQSGGGGGQSYSAGGGSGSGGGGNGADLRLKAMRAVGEAMPPSDGDGTDGQDWEALNAIRSLYFARKPGSVEKLGGQRQKIAEAGLARLGYDPALVKEEYQRSRPGQASVRRA